MSFATLLKSDCAPKLRRFPGDPNDYWLTEEEMSDEAYEAELATLAEWYPEPDAPPETTLESALERARNVGSYEPKRPPKVRNWTAPNDRLFISKWSRAEWDPQSLTALPGTATFPMPADAANMLALRLNLNSMQDVRRGRRRSYTWHAVIRDHRDMSRVLRVPPDERFDPSAMTDSPIGTSERRLTKDMADQECQAFNRTMLSLPPEPTFWWCFVVRPLTIANPL